MTPTEQIKAFLAVKSGSERPRGNDCEREEHADQLSFQIHEKPKEDSSGSVPCVPVELSDEQLAEAHRIAKELVKLYHAGAIKGPDDPEAVFYACLIRDFGASFTGKDDARGAQRDEFPT